MAWRAAYGCGTPQKVVALAGTGERLEGLLADAQGPSGGDAHTTGAERGKDNALPGLHGAAHRVIVVTGQA